MNNKVLIILLSLMVWSYACEKEDLVEKEKYYDSEIFLEENVSIYGKWDLIENSGGIAGTGKQIDAKVILEIKRYGRYKLYQDQSLTEFGKITIIRQERGELVILFEPDDETVFSLFDTVEKTVMIEGQDLWLSDPCCDLFQYHFRK
jgi:hypothetical protein